MLEEEAGRTLGALETAEHRSLGPPDTPVTIVIGVVAQRIGSAGRSRSVCIRGRFGLNADVPLACLGGCS